MKVFERDEAQEKAIEKMVATRSGGALNGSGTGVGKTIIAVRTLGDRGGKRNLIIAPPNTFDNWAETLEIITGDKLRFCGNQKFSTLVTAAEAKENMAAAQRGDDGWFFVGRETFLAQCRIKVPVFTGRGAAREPMIDPKTGKQKIRVDFKYIWGDTRAFDGAAYDEVQMAASNTSKSSQAWKNLQATFKLAQSADPFGSQLENMHTMAKNIWPDWLDMNKNEFIDEYLETEYDHFAFGNKKVTGEIWPGYFMSTLPCYVAIPSPVEKPEPEKRYVDLLPAQRKLYDKLAEDMAAEIDGDLMIVELPMHLNMRLRELSLGLFRPVDTFRIDKETGEEIPTQTVRFEPGDPSAKIDEIKSIMADHPGEHFIIATESQKFAEKMAIDLGGLPYTGKQSDAEKAKNKEAFLRGDVKVLVGTSAMAEGLDGLQDVCRVAIIASRFSVGFKLEQFLGRIARRGQKRTVLAYEIVARDTIEVGVVQKSIQKILDNNRAKALELKKQQEEEINER